MAYSAAKLGVDAIIVAPLGTLQNQVREWLQSAAFDFSEAHACLFPLSVYRVQQVSHSTKCQVKIIEHGTDFDASLKEAYRIAQTEGRSLVHPYDDPLVIAGNGTVGMEILKEVGH